ncbi:hypothetical protein D3C81_2257190 [compost metagenome]
MSIENYSSFPDSIGQFFAYDPLHIILVLPGSPSWEVHLLDIRLNPADINIIGY